MKQIKMLTIVLCCVVALSMTCLVHAKTVPQASSASVNIYANSAGTGSDVTQCSVGTQLWVFWTQSPNPSTVEVKIVGPNGVTVYDASGLAASASGTIKFTLSQSGTYYVIVIGAENVILGSDVIASATVFVLPESALGALAATTAAFGALGVFTLRKRKMI